MRHVYTSIVVMILGTLAFAQEAPTVLQQPIQSSRVVDLTQPMYEDMPFWPGGVPFRMERLVDYDEGYRLHSFEMGENTGTHVDAPAHFVEGGDSIDDLSLDQLVVPAVVIDVKEQVAGNDDFQLSADDVRAWEAEHGEIPAGTLVLLDTGWSERFGEPGRYNNMDDEGVMHFPGYGDDAAELLVERDVAGIGIDTPSLDHGAAEAFTTHGVMLAAGKYQVENLTNLAELPPSGATVVIGVLPVREGTQAQARVFAFLP